MKKKKKKVSNCSHDQLIVQLQPYMNSIMINCRHFMTNDDISYVTTFSSEKDKVTISISKAVFGLRIWQGKRKKKGKS